MERSVLLLVLWLFCEADEMKTISVMEGDFSTHLPTPKILRKHQACSGLCELECSASNVPNATLSWYKGRSLFSFTASDQNTNLSLCLEVEYLDKNTYSCVLQNHISHRTTHLDKTRLILLCPPTAQRTVLAMEGDSVTLDSDFTDIQMVDQIMWMFGPQDIIIAEEFKKQQHIDVYDTGKFAGRLLLNNKTGDLTITNTRRTDSGVYKLQMNSNLFRCSGFNVTVYDRLPDPVITSNSSLYTSIFYRSCPMLCSVVNVSHVTLSWFKGNSVLSSISASDLSISLSLPLEVDYQDKNTYSCVLHNPIRNQTQHLDISGLCPDHIQMLKIFIVLTVVFVVSLGVLFLVGVKVCGRANKNDAGSRTETSENSPPVASSGDTPGTIYDEQDNENLISGSPSLRASQEYISLSHLCFK